MRLGLSTACWLLAAGCSKQPATPPEHSAAVLNQATMGNYSDSLQAANDKRAREHAELMAAVETAKTEVPESRVAALLQEQGGAKAKAQRNVRVYGCALRTRDTEPRELAELSARQLLVLACGACLVQDEQGVQLSSVTKIPGAVATEIEGASGYLIISLEASVPAPDLAAFSINAASVRHVSDTTTLEQAATAMAERAHEALRDMHERSNATGTGLVVLRKMELIPRSIPPKCRYYLDLYARD